MTPGKMLMEGGKDRLMEGCKEFLGKKRREDNVSLDEIGPG